MFIFMKAKSNARSILVYVTQSMRVTFDLHQDGEMESLA